MCLLFGASLGADSLDDAGRSFARGEYRQTVENARAALALEPSAPAWLLLGRALESIGENAPAADAFRQAASLGEQAAPEAQVALALLRRHGAEHDAALQELRAVLDNYPRLIGSLSSANLQALASAAQALAPSDASLFRDAVSYYRAAIDADPDNLSARVALGNLLLTKHNNADALNVYRDALARDETNAPALLGLARSQHFDNHPAAMDTALASLKAQPSLVAANVFVARLYLESHDYSRARQHLEAAFATNPQSLSALAMQAALSYLTDDLEQFNRQLAFIREQAPNYSDVFALLAQFAERNRRYHESRDFSLNALSIDNENWDAMASLGINRLRLGEMRTGRGTLELAFEGDPFNVRVKNTLDLLDKMSTFATVRSQNVELVAERDRAELLAPLLIPIAEKAFAHYSERYSFSLPTPLRIEMFSNHADFSVRTVGLTGLDILGASFGPVVLLDSPKTEAPGAFNWASALWHEIAHSFHLAMSAHRAPRWFSEGLAVYEERRARPGWGGDVSPGFLAAFHTGKLRPASTLEDAFLAPRFAAEIPYSYYLSSLLIERIEEEHGAESLVSLLHQFAGGDNSMQSIAEHLGYTAEAFDAFLDDYVRERFEHALEVMFGSAEAADEDLYEALLQKGTAALTRDQLDEAERLLTEAQAMFPEHAGPGGSYTALAELYRRRGEIESAIVQLLRNIAIDADDLHAHIQLADLYFESGDDLGAEKAAERTLLIQPFHPGIHERLAMLYERREATDLAVRAWRAVLRLDPDDPVATRYKLADVLHRSGNLDEARLELLQALEQAPLFDQGLELLLKIRADKNPVDSHDAEPG